MTLNDYIVSLLRTIVPGVVGAAASSALALDIDPAAAVVIVTAVYYAILRAVESRYPVVGVALGWKSSPSYAAGGDDE